jgi:4-amino-4-deoxy-L-arabinose transferase-like glycosyltransferase
MASGLDFARDASGRRPLAPPPLWGLLLLGLALRLAAIWLVPDQSINLPDAEQYRNSASQLLHGGFIVFPYFMPLYPTLIALTGPGWGQLFADILLSTALIWLVYELALALFADAAIALIAAAGVALYPQFIFFAVVGMSESLFMALFVGAFLCWYRGRFVAAAVLAVLSILTRPAVDLLAPLLVLYFALAIHRLPIGKAIWQMVIYGLIYCALMAPWWWHNVHFRGTFVRLSLGGGENFYSGNNPMNKTGGGIRGVDYSNQAFDHIADPVARDRALWNAGLTFIRENPGHFVEFAGIKFLRFWRLWPFTEAYSSPLIVAIYVTGYVPIFLLTLLYLARWGFSDFIRIAPMLAFAAYLTLVDMVFVASLRYRLPIEPFMIVLAATAVVRTARRWPAANRLLERLAAPVRSGAAGGHHAR